MVDKIYPCSCGKQLHPIINVRVLPKLTKKEREYWHVECDCGIPGPVSYSREDAILKWNYLRNKGG